MNNNQPGGHGWEGQYGYPNQQPHRPGYGQPPRQPAVVIPRIPPEELAQYYSQQPAYHQSPAAFHQPPAGYYQPPVAPSPHEQQFSPHMHYMPQQQMMFNHQPYHMNYQSPQNYASPQLHHMPPPSFPTPSPVQPQPPSLPQSQPPPQPRSASQSGPSPASRQPQMAQQRRQSSTPSQQKPRRPSEQQPIPPLAKRPKVNTPTIKSSPQSTAISTPQPLSRPLSSKPTPQSAERMKHIPDDRPEHDVDYQLLLLSLADQYISAARGLSNDLSRSGSNTDLSQYHELMTSGLTCLDSAINNWKNSDPRGEARLRLQYANLLLEETDNDDTALAVLSKGINVCERSRLWNQKFSMQHLLARIQFKTNPKAAFKHIDSVLEDLVAYKNVIWIYVFRFLRISLAMQRGSGAHVPQTIQQLRGLVSLAGARRDVPVLVMAHVYEAALHIKSRSSESVEHAQRAIAAARSYQLDPALQRIPQLRALVQATDLCCDLATNTPDQLDAKVTVLQELVDQLGKDNKVWLSSNFQLPTSLPASDDLVDHTSGILRGTHDGKASIAFTWLNKNELFMLGFLVSGVAKLQKDCLDERAEGYLSEGITYAKSRSVEKKMSNKSLDTACASVAREESLNIAMQIAQVFARSIRSNWTHAKSQLAGITTTHSPETQDKYRQVLVYLDGVIKQAQGDLEGALACYSSPLLSLPTSTSKMAGHDLDLRILATLNKILILKSSSATMAGSETLLDAVYPVCQNHHNPSIQSAANLVRTTIAPDQAVIKLKSFLTTSLACAQRTSNQQLLSMVMNLMVVRFFSGIVGDQAEKSARVGYQFSRKMRSAMWTAASATNLASCYDFNGRTNDAQMYLDEADASWDKAPEGVRAHFVNSAM